MQLYNSQLDSTNTGLKQSVTYETQRKRISPEQYLQPL